MNLDMNNLEPRDVMLLNSINKISTLLACVANAVSNLAPQPASDWRDSDCVEIDSDARETMKPDGTPNSTEHIVAMLDDLGVRLAVTTWADDGFTACYGEAGREILARNPDELREIARRYREVYAPAMEHIASLWEAGRDAGEIPTTEATI